MPRRKHWFPVSHDINSDPEMHELTETYGEWMLAVWLEMLSISDRNEGEIKGTPEYIAKSLTWLFHSNSRRYNTEWRRNKLLMAFEWMSNKGWIRVERTSNEHRIGTESDKFIVVNHWKYHRTQEREPHAPILPTQPILTEPIKNAEPAPSVDFKQEEPKKKTLDPKVKEVADRIYRADPQRFARLIAWIKDKEKRDYPPEVVAETLAQFEARDKTGKVKDWWPYLDRIHTKLYGQWNEVQAAKAKGDESKFILNLVKAVSGGMKP